MTGTDGATLSKIDREAAEWLARLRGGEPGEQRAFENWYSADHAHADAYDRVLASWEATGGLTTFEPGRPALRRHWMLAVAAVAAIVLVCVGLGTGRNVTPRSGSDAVALTTSTGEIRTVALADGSRVTLDTQSAISAEFDASRRQVRLLRGRAHFDVNSEPRPFVIATDAGAISTGGAGVDVSIDGSTTRVGLLSGTAKIRPTSQSASLFRLLPGRSVVVGRDGLLEPPTAFSASDTRWTNGMLSFEDAPLSRVIALANRYSATQIVLADPALGTLKFTGTFKARDSLALARMIAAMFGLHCEEADSRRLKLSRPAG